MKKFALAALVVITAGCSSVPADPEHSYDIAQKEGLLAGYTDNIPWVYEDKNGEVKGIEAEILLSFAKVNGMNVIWKKGSEQEIFKMLEKKKLHIVIAGLPDDTPWKKQKTGITMPYYKDGKHKHVFAVMQGENKMTKKIEEYFFANRSKIYYSVTAAAVNEQE